MTKYSLKYHYATLMYRYIATHKIDRKDKIWKDMIDYIIDNYPQEMERLPISYDIS